MPRDRTEDWQRWCAALLTALLHLALLLLVLWMPSFVNQSARGGAAGGRTAVTFIDESARTPPHADTPNPHATPPRKRRKPVHASTRVMTTPVAHADAPLPPQADTQTDTAVVPPEHAPTPPPQPDTASGGAPDATTSPPTQAWGMPPGMLPRDTALENAGTADSPAVVNRGRVVDASAGTGLEVGGYQVYYDLQDEPLLRTWRKQGMTELFMPLPGERRLMVCPLETALRRESGPCRLVEPNAPELKHIGDARDVITMQRIYRLGNVLWSGPGAYR